MIAPTGPDPLRIQADTKNLGFSHGRYHVAVHLPDLTNHTSLGIACLLCLACTLTVGSYVAGADNTASYTQEGDFHEGTVIHHGDQHQSELFQHGQVNHAFIEQARRLSIPNLSRLKAAGSVRVEVETAMDAYFHAIVGKPLPTFEQWVS